MVKSGHRGEGTRSPNLRRSDRANEKQSGGGLRSRLAWMNSPITISVLHPSNSKRQLLKKKNEDTM